MNEIEKIINKAIEDPAFAAQLKREAKEAQEAGSGSPEWRRLMENFTDKPETLEEDGACWTTFTTITSIDCLITTTTTTVLHAAE